MENELKNIARVHSIESFGTVDGPGIRFVLFLQGCSLKCKYCHNRDTWDMTLGEEKTLEGIVEKVNRYKTYMTLSGGGVTVTGGEPLLQVKFLIEFFKRLKEENINTCIDTSGMFNITDDIREVLRYTDLVLLDIKHIDDKKCKELVGASNKKELEFARYLSDNGKKMWIRQVLVPGYTDDEKDLLRLKDFLSTLKTVEKVQILKYHSMGKYKWEKLGLKYELEGVRDATIEDEERAKKILEIQ